MNKLDTSVSLKELAAHARVHKSTVARALRNHPRISKPTCLRIQRLARELGYQPDPHMRRLMAQVREKDADRRRGVLGFWNPFPMPSESKGIPSELREVYLGAKEQANSLGYALNEFRQVGRQESDRRVAGTIRNRGIEGVLVFPHTAYPFRIREDFSDFAAVTINYGLAYPQLHRIVNDSRYALDTCLKNLRQRGFARIGLVLPHNMIKIPFLRHSHLGIIADYSRSGEIDIAVLYSDGSGIEEIAQIKQWREKEQPEVIVGMEVSDLPGVIRTHLGLRIPGDIGYASFSLHEDEVGTIAGVQSPARSLGAYAIKRIVSMLHTGEKGVPTIPETTLIPGKWRPGDSLPYNIRSGFKTA